MANSIKTTVLLHQADRSIIQFYVYGARPKSLRCKIDIQLSSEKTENGEHKLVRKLTQGNILGGRPAGEIEIRSQEEKYETKFAKIKEADFTKLNSGVIRFEVDNGTTIVLRGARYSKLVGMFNTPRTFSSRQPERIQQKLTNVEVEFSDAKYFMVESQVKIHNSTKAEYDKVSKLFDAYCKEASKLPETKKLGQSKSMDNLIEFLSATDEDFDAEDPADYYDGVIIAWDEFYKEFAMTYGVAPDEVGNLKMTDMKKFIESVCLGPKESENKLKTFKEALNLVLAEK